MHSWRVLILPFMEQKELYDEYDFSEPWNGPNNSKLASRRPRQYLLHGVDDDGGDTTNYLAVVGAETAWSPTRTFTQGFFNAKQTDPVAVVENVGSGISWLEPRDLNFETMSFTIQDDPPNGVSSWLQPPGVTTFTGGTLSLDMEMSPEELRSMFVVKSGGELPAGVTELEDGRDRPLKKSR